MEVLSHVFRLLAASQAILLIFYLLVYHRTRLGLVLALLVLSFLAYLVIPLSAGLQGQPGMIRYPLAFLATSIPAILWVLARWFFYDDRRVPVGIWPVYAVYVLLFMTNDDIQAALVAPAGIRNFVFYFVPQLIKLALVLHVIYMAIDGLDSDLVEDRLKLRIPVALGSGVITASVILVEIWGAGSRIPMSIEAGGAALMFALALGANLYLFKLRAPLQLADIDGAATRDAREPLDDALIARLTAEMTKQRFYANHGATIGDLEERLDVPSYRLRNVINRQLGFRNFNQYLNEFRIREASRRLREEDLPILSIALDVGFKSLSSFNKAFRDLHGMTPTEFRTGKTPGKPDGF